MSYSFCFSLLIPPYLPALPHFGVPRQPAKEGGRERRGRQRRARRRGGEPGPHLRERGLGNGRSSGCFLLFSGATKDQAWLSVLYIKLHGIVFFPVRTLHVRTDD